MKELLEHIESLKKAFAKLQPLSVENQQKLDRKFRMEWNFNSNHIEGNTLTYGETELLLIFGETKGNHEYREYEEMKGHDVALKLIYNLAMEKENNLTEKFIRELNQIILVKPYYKEAITEDGQQTRKLIKTGEYKLTPNSVRLYTGEIFEYSTPIETPALMNDMMNWYINATNDNSQHPIEIAAELHYRFVRIHPFDDGNGRIGRLLINYHLIRNKIPPVIIKSTDKKNYLYALHQADSGIIEPFKKFIAEQLIWSYEISIKAAKGENIDETGDWEKKIQILKRKTSDKINIYNKKNIEILKSTIEQSVIPLIQGVNNKLAPLFDLYANQSFYLAINGNGIRSNTFHDFLTINLFVKEDLYNLFYSHTLNTFLKNDINTFNSHYNIVFKFSDSIYTISYKNILTIDVQKTYGEFLTQEEIQSIETYIAENIYTQIEQELKKTTK